MGLPQSELGAVTPPVEHGAVGRAEFRTLHILSGMDGQKRDITRLKLSGGAPSSKIGPAGR